MSPKNIYCYIPALNYQFILTLLIGVFIGISVILMVTAVEIRRSFSPMITACVLRGDTECSADKFMDGYEKIIYQSLHWSLDIIGPTIILLTTILFVIIAAENLHQKMFRPRNHEKYN